ncbi:TetR/AcrR family transcriptional regulator [Kutzneria albida]|uniref:HTH tetR-type domain-containing protein n=1 Tax=Kutzneria albida DSM 43870 TaxID=1449976 RepID=W5WKS9_9PSEU|nr:TetR/AcrR family transcriptional regulator [Kutzneria albida]AHI01142.1 hypothetical protein KALB_7784 [Kutzneria albida DSM 43870]
MSGEVKRASSPRQRYKEQNRAEIKRVATEQLALGGAGALSLSAIAGQLGFTTPALYRYFANRDELLTELITDGYADLAEVVERAAAQEGTAVQRLHALAHAFRRWALGQPQVYLLLQGAPVPGYQAPAHTVDSARRVLGPFVAVFEQLRAESDTELDRQFGSWIEQDGAVRTWVAEHGSTNGWALRAAVTAWTRMHGILSLELQGNFGGMAFDPALLFEIEVDALSRPATP